MELSLIILNYKSKGDTLNCIKSIKEADFGMLKYEIIVVDNNSNDSIGEILNWQHPEIKFIQNKENIGMGAGNNVGLRRAAGKYSVVINPDIIVVGDVFIRLYQYMEANPQVGIVGPMQLYPNQEIQDSCYRWHGVFTPIYRRTPLGNLRFAQKNISRFLMKDYDHLALREVDWLLGSFLFCRQKTLQVIGLFDERFFMYFEDTDLCRRCWQFSWKVVYNPEAKIIHNHARQSARVAWYMFFTNKAARLHIASWMKYVKKWGAN